MATTGVPLVDLATGSITEVVRHVDDVRGEQRLPRDDTPAGRLARIRM